MEIVTMLMNLEDKPFQKALVKGIVNCKKGIIIKELNKAIADTDSVANVDLVLVDNASKLKGHDLRHKEILLISKSEYEQLDPRGGTIKVYKYRNIKSMIGCLSDIIFTNYGKSLPCSTDNNAKLVYVYQSCGGCGATSIALEIGRQLCDYEDKKVLYINCEKINSGFRYLPMNEYVDLRKLAFYISKGSPHKIESYISEKNGLFYLTNASRLNPFSIFEDAILNKLISHICSNESFDYLVLDAGVTCMELQNGIDSTADIKIEVGRHRCNYNNVLETETENPSNRIAVINRYKEDGIDSANIVEPHGNNNSLFIINEDEEGFGLKDNLIDIKQYSNFSSQIKGVIEIIRKDNVSGFPERSEI